MAKRFFLISLFFQSLVTLILATIQLLTQHFGKKSIHASKSYPATAAAVADPSKNLEAREAELLYVTAAMPFFLQVSLSTFLLL